MHSCLVGCFIISQLENFGLFGGESYPLGHNKTEKYHFNEFDHF